MEEAAFVFLCGELPHIVAAILELGFSSLDIYPPMCNPVRAIVSIYRFVHRYKTPPRFKAVDATCEARAGVSTKPDDGTLVVLELR